jgi:hypothetical protein
MWSSGPGIRIVVARSAVHSWPHAVQWSDTTTCADVFDSTLCGRPAWARHFGHDIGMRQRFSVTILNRTKARMLPKIAFHTVRVGVRPNLNDDSD